jgi:TRAP-type C4-dicarboxylate transport system permease small subunit
MLLLAFTQVILRNYFSTSVLWADTFLRHMVLWIGFIGASIAAHEEKHINLDVISRLASSHVVHFIRIVTSLFAATVCGFMMNAGWVFLMSEKENGEELFAIGTTSFPTWWFQIIIPVGFALLTLRFLLKSLEHGIRSLSPSSKNPPVSNVPAPEV